MNRHTTHWCHGRSVPGPVDPDGCCAGQPTPLTDDDLRDAVRAILDQFPMSDDGTGHIADCGYTHEQPMCGCYSLPERLAVLIAARERAAAEPPSDVTEDELAKTIWTASRADESTISATGANIVARAVLAAFHVTPRAER